MSFTRRHLLRSAALASAGSALPAWGQHANHRRKAAADAGCTGTRPPAFNSGIRVFFAGAWLFCKDPNSANVLAVTGLPSNTDMPHLFPFGMWASQSDWDRSPLQPQLQPAGKGQASIALNVTGTTAPASSLSQLSAAANKLAPLSTFLGGKLTFGDNSLRIVSLPLPTSILPVTFRTQTQVTGPTNLLAPMPMASMGMATTHVFAYDGASSLSMQAPGSSTPVTVISSASTGDAANLHFHTVPASKPKAGHDVMMFAYLMGLISPDHTKVTLAPGNPDTEPICPGPLAPANVSYAELEMQTPGPRFPMLVDLANCGSGGGIVDGGP